MMNNTTETTTVSAPELLISNTQELKERVKNIPDKLGFKIGEVANYVGVKQYVLRYWETEFEILHPKKSGNGQRFYTRRDIETALIIKKLLHEDRFSIEGARSFLKRLRQNHKSILSLDTDSQETPPDLVLSNTIPSGIETAASGASQVRRIDMAQILDPQRPDVTQVQKMLAQREKEINQYWCSSVEYFVEEVRQARKRLLG